MIRVIIPARGGSKGLKRKNMALLKGKPLLQWTLDIAKRVSDQVIVTTDDKQIREYSEYNGAFVIKRPAKLARDKIHSVYSILHVLEVVEAKDDDIIIMLLPTSPLRTTKDVKGCLALLRPHASVISICENPPEVSLRLMNTQNNSLFSLTGFDDHNLQRQDVAQLYAVNGSIYISHARTLKDFQTFHIPLSYGYVMPKHRSVDINTLEDLKLAEKLL